MRRSIPNNSLHRTWPGNTSKSTKTYTLRPDGVCPCCSHRVGLKNHSPACRCPCAKCVQRSAAPLSVFNNCLSTTITSGWLVDTTWPGQRKLFVRPDQFAKAFGVFPDIGRKRLIDLASNKLHRLIDAAGNGVADPLRNIIAVHQSFVDDMAV